MKLSSCFPGATLLGSYGFPRVSDTYYRAPGFAVEKGILVRQVKSVEILGTKRDTAHWSQRCRFPRPWGTTLPP